MNIQIKLGEGAKLPVNAHESDTGYDVIAAFEPKIVGQESIMGGWRSIDYIEYDTNISIAPECVTGTVFADFNPGEPKRNPWPTIPLKYGYLDVRPRSSVSKYNLVLANSPATIDCSYRGTIKLRFRYLFQPEDLFIQGDSILGRINSGKIYKRGDKIAQLVAAWKEPISWEQVSELPETARADGGFGSSGK